ncbi:heterokaryon incompatibility protein-domain-containing protein [Suillus cothurnatus]|nr:heterokaryon incompatibility protein-domain-containing protein [Suillus cothurnatus]
MNTEPRNACITGDLSTAEELLKQEIQASGVNNHQSYANRSFVRARKRDWDRALQDALESISLRPSSTGYISKGIALCGKNHLQDALRAFDSASVFTGSDSETTLLHLIKARAPISSRAVALFNANQHNDAIMRVQELTAICPKAYTHACRVVEAYLCVHLGTTALDGGHHKEAAEHFNTAVKANAFTSQLAIRSKYQDFVVLFGWDLESLWKNANQGKCDALLRAGRLGEASGWHQYMMAFMQKCNAPCANGVAELTAGGDTALDKKDYDQAIELYSAVIELDSATDTIFANRSKARLLKMLWEDALLDAEKVIKLNPSAYLGYQLKHEALHGAQCYDEAVDAYQIMLSKLDKSADPEGHKLYQDCISPFEAERAIVQVIQAHLDDAPLHLINTYNGRLCDREAQIDAFKRSAEYEKLLACIIKDADLQSERIQDVVAMYFRWVMLSHRWGEKEPLLHDIQDKVVYELDSIDSIAKLQSFCEITRDAGFLWAWIDTCCIDQTNNVELQVSVNSMFIWYRHSALTIIYLSDVPPSSQPGALARSSWNTRGWTVQEFLAPKFVLFYQKDWSLYLDDRSPNHKDSLAIMQEMGHATGIDAQALIAFSPGMRNPREKLQWVKDIASILDIRTLEIL